MRQRFMVMSQRSAWDIKQTLEVLQNEGYFYVAHINCDDCHMVLIVEQDEEQVEFLEATADYPVLLVPERIKLWSVKQPIPGTPSSVD